MAHSGYSQRPRLALADGPRVTEAKPLNSRASFCAAGALGETQGDLNDHQPEARPSTRSR
jgi:hypothetical protein